jgi:hypothetical protein
VRADRGPSKSRPHSSESAIVAARHSGTQLHEEIAVSRCGRRMTGACRERQLISDGRVVT